MSKRQCPALHRRCVTVLLSLILIIALCPAALADTDGTEPKITQQPDQLILQLGTRWAGVEFELRTDAGVFPVPVVVDEYGILTMDLGGSTTYTLSCIESTVPIPDPAPEPEAEQPVDSQQPAVQQPSTPAASNQGIPPLHLVLFLGGLVFAVGGLVALYLAKRSRQAMYDEWDDDEEEP